LILSDNARKKERAIGDEVAQEPENPAGKDRAQIQSPGAFPCDAFFWLLWSVDPDGKTASVRKSSHSPVQSDCFKYRKRSSNRDDCVTFNRAFRKSLHNPTTGLL
ncbi:MAG: hypothetical protein ACE5HO_18640, partial [bacterium]